MLTAAEQRRTGEELRANFELSGLTADEVAADLQFSATQLESTLAVDDASDPVDVWELRDYLEQAVRDSGGLPVAFSVLTEGARAAANGWFGLRTAPRHVPAS